jgi:hypothetical protein
VLVVTRLHHRGVGGGEALGLKVAGRVERRVMVVAGHWTRWTCWTLFDGGG